jgi:hypothetical protein
MTAQIHLVVELNLSRKIEFAADTLWSNVDSTLTSGSSNWNLLHCIGEYNTSTEQYSLSQTTFYDTTVES